MLEISRIRNSLAEGLIEKGGIRKLEDLVEEHQSMPRTIRDTSVLPLFSNDEDIVGSFDQAWEKARSKHESIEDHSLHFLKKSNQLRVIIHSAHIPMFLSRHPLMTRTVKMMSFIWNSLKDLKDSKNEDLVQKKMMRILTALGQLMDLHFYQGEPNTDLAMLVATDIAKIF